MFFACVVLRCHIVLEVECKFMRKLGNGVPSLLLEAELECQLLRELGIGMPSLFLGTELQFRTNGDLGLCASFVQWKLRCRTGVPSACGTSFSRSTCVISHARVTHVCFSI